MDIGAILFAKRDFNGAKEAYRKALEIEPGFARARIALAGINLAMGNQDKAEENLILARKTDSDNE